MPNRIDFSLTPVPGSCIGCEPPKRRIGCHSTCPEYIAYRAKCDEEIEKRAVQRRICVVVGNSIGHNGKRQWTDAMVRYNAKNKKEMIE